VDCIDKYTVRINPVERYILAEIDDDRKTIAQATWLYINRPSSLFLTSASRSCGRKACPHTGHTRRIFYVASQLAVPSYSKLRPQLQIGSTCLALPAYGSVWVFINSSETSIIRRWAKRVSPFETLSVTVRNGLVALDSRPIVIGRCERSHRLSYRGN
jgi:hypothetical protein